MSRSYRTQKESSIAERRIARYDDGSIVLPRVIERSPKIGDVHPLSKRRIITLLKKIPVEYVYGLDRIELRARENSSIGKPFGLYRRDEKAIILYSLPTVWRLHSLSIGLAKTLAKFHADVTFDDTGVEVSWKHEVLFALWFDFTVFRHELGHHFVEQYKHKNGRLLGRQYNELIAELHSERFTDEFIAKVKAKKQKSAPNNKAG